MHMCVLCMYAVTLTFTGDTVTEVNSAGLDPTPNQLAKLNPH